MKKIKKHLLIPLLFSIGIVAQERTLNKAYTTFKKESYISAIHIYERLANKGLGSEQIYEKLGDANYFNANYVQAEQWYTKRYELKGTFPNEFLYRYAQSLKSAGKTQKAREIMAQYAKANPTQLRAKSQSRQLAQESIKKGSDTFTIQNLITNTKYSDYSSTIKGDTLLFASARPRTMGNQIYQRTGQPFTNLYCAVKQADGSYSKAELYSKNTFSIFHEASPVFTKDGNTMYYTQNELQQDHQRKVVNGRYKIYKSVKENGKWKSQGVLPIFKNDTIRVAHPALSPDNTTLYFASDAAGTYGQSDLYKIELHPDGTIGNPENLGTTVNTEGRESYPFVTKDNILLFASDGHPGQGGFDIFALDLNQEGATPVHLNAPINSAFDDFGLNWDRSTHQGVFTSNRPEGQGDDDLYGFTNTSPFFEFDYNARIIGKVLDKNTNLPLAKARVVLYNSQGKELGSTTTDENGDFVFEQVLSNASYTTRASKETYSTNDTRPSLALYERQTSTIIVLDQDQYKLEQGLDLAKALSLRHIYFDLDKWNIRKDARVELEKIVEVLQQNPTIKIEIGSHTDSRQSKGYNQALSQRRAKSTMEYLIKQGIAKSRLRAKGYGESQLVNHCSDTVGCSEAEHQLNRRSTFVIVEE